MDCLFIRNLTLICESIIFKPQHFNLNHLQQTSQPFYSFHCIGVHLPRQAVYIRTFILVKQIFYYSEKMTSFLLKTFNWVTEWP